ncbi:MAG: BatD family protein, partial [Chthoniobacterales bacterium]
MRAGMNLRFAWLFFAALLLSGASVRAEVLTVLSRNETEVGRPVVLLYRFVNTEQPEDMPDPTIMVNGLQIRFQGASRQNNFSFSFGGGGGQNRSESVFEYTYAVTPLQPGQFTIPGFDVRVGGKTIRTKPAKLKVFGAGGVLPPPQPVPQVPPGILPQPVQPLPPPGGQPSGPPDREGEPYFAELLMTSKPVYVGEVVPVDIRFYFRGDIPLSDVQHPTFSGDGFTAVPLGEPQQSEQMVGNLPYRVITFRSAITAVKTGEIEIPPVTMAGRMMVSAVPPGFDALFDQFFRNMPGMGRAEPVEVSTRGRTLKVLALPKEGRPADFSG